MTSRRRFGSNSAVRKELPRMVFPFAAARRPTICPRSSRRDFAPFSLALAWISKTRVNEPREQNGTWGPRDFTPTSRAVSPSNWRPSVKPALTQVFTWSPSEAGLDTTEIRNWCTRYSLGYNTRCVDSKRHFGTESIPQSEHLGG